MVSIPLQPHRNRLIVLVPTGLAGSLELARKIYWLAIREQMDVYYLALVDDENKLLTVSRQMATMRAVTFDNQIKVNWGQTVTSHWLKNLREIYAPGDVIVCHQEQMTARGFLKTEPLSNFLQTNLKATVITLAGFYRPHRELVKSWLAGLLAWIGFLVIIAFFTLLEIQVDNQLQGVGRISLDVALLCVEFWVLFAWYRLTAR